jgi:hypothetical protein
LIVPLVMLPELNSIWNPRPHRLHSIDRHLGVRDGVRNDGCSEPAGRCGDIDSTQSSHMPLINAVIGMRGNAMITTMLMAGLAAAWQKFGIYDGVKAGFADHLQAISKAVAKQWTQLQGPDCLEMDVIVAGLVRKRWPGFVSTADNGEHADASVAGHRYRRSSSHPEQRCNICRSQRTMCKFGHRHS